jgi:hypothetical protein
MTISSFFIPTPGFEYSGNLLLKEIGLSFK